MKKRNLTKAGYFLKYLATTLAILITAFAAVKLTRMDVGMFMEENRRLFNTLQFGFVAYLMGIFATELTAKRKLAFKKCLQISSYYVLISFVIVYAMIAMEAYIAYREVFQISLWTSPLVAGLITYFVFLKPPVQNEEMEVVRKIRL